MAEPRLNTRARGRVAGDLEPGEEILAMVSLNDTVGTGGAHSDGTARQGSTVFSLPYAERLGCDYADRSLRIDLVASWCTVTPHRLLFHKHKQLAVRPTPGDLIDRIPLEGTTLRYFDTDGFSLANRVLHLDFADGRRLLSATILRPGLRKKTYSDEPDLFVAAFGDRATPVEQA